MRFNNKTKLFLSASSSPTNFGVTIYNQLFKTYDINAVYLPRKVITANELIDSIKCLSIAGCSVSMPLKDKVINYLDNLDELAEKTNSVNTIVNQDGKLTGYNTDCFGAQTVLEKINPESVLIYGAGSVTNSVITALKNINCTNISLVNRTDSKANLLIDKYGLNHDFSSSFYDLLINTTPSSNDINNFQLFSLLERAKSLLDLVVSPLETALVKQANIKNLSVINGIEMSKYQLQKQFFIYTKVFPDLKDIEISLESYNLNS